MNVKKLVFCGIFTALICVGAFIKIPLPPVPMTLQFLFVNLAILYLDKNYARLAILAYIILGLVGLPIFAGGGGIGYVLKPTFGYILGFLVAAIVSGELKQKLGDGLKSNLLLSLMNIVIIYLFGVSYFYILSNFYLHSPIALSKLIVVGCFLFIPSDLISGIVSSFLSVRLTKILN